MDLLNIILDLALNHFILHLLYLLNLFGNAFLGHVGQHHSVFAKVLLRHHVLIDEAATEGAELHTLLLILPVY